jgi:hypothetical protein
MERNFWMIVRAEHLCAFERDGTVAERGSFGAAGDDSDVEGHDYREVETNSIPIANFQLPILQANLARRYFHKRPSSVDLCSN